MAKTPEMARRIRRLTQMKHSIDMKIAAARGVGDPNDPQLKTLRNLHQDVSRRLAKLSGVAPQMNA